MCFFVPIFFFFSYLLLWLLCMYFIMLSTWAATAYTRFFFSHTSLHTKQKNKQINNQTNREVEKDKKGTFLRSSQRVGIDPRLYSYIITIALLIVFTYNS